MRAYSRHNADLSVYDDGFPGDPIFVHRDSMGVLGVVRARTWEDAYSVCEDEFFPSADVEDYESGDFKTIYVSGREVPEEHLTDTDRLFQFSGENAYKRPGREIPYTGELIEHPCWEEQFGFRPNGPNHMPGDTGVYQKDLNGESLDQLTMELSRRTGIRVSFPEDCTLYGDWSINY
jgi:hypothetical protein